MRTLRLREEEYFAPNHIESELGLEFKSLNSSPRRGEGRGFFGCEVGTTRPPSKPEPGSQWRSGRPWASQGVPIWGDSDVSILLFPRGTQKSISYQEPSFLWGQAFCLKMHTPERWAEGDRLAERSAGFSMQGRGGGNGGALQGHLVLHLVLAVAVACGFETALTART